MVIFYYHATTQFRKITLSSSMSPSVEQTDNTFLFYIKQKIRSLTSSDTTVMLLVDEIHLKPFYDYKGGTVVGTSFNNCTAAAKSAFAFMINSVFSNYKDVVHLLPTSKISAEDLHLFLKKIICGLENIGFRVFAVITDNNAINRKAMSQFAVPSKLSIAYPHRCDQKRPLFFVFDSVYILKCIRNNWLNLKSHDKSFAFPHFQFGDISTKSSTSYALASFSSLVHLHNTECDSLIKFAYKLSYKALNPSTFERQNVKLALQIFNNFTAEALEILREKTQNPFNSDTQAFIKIIVTWWKIVNVKTPNKGKRLKNCFEEPLTMENSTARKYFEYFANWIEEWRSSNTDGGKLTKETFAALGHTTHALLEITEYCIKELNAKYVLLRKFQTDCLESRFGQYRQLARGNYEVSLRQIYECEKKIRLMSVLL